MKRNRNPLKRWKWDIFCARPKWGKVSLLHFTAVAQLDNPDRQAGKERYCIGIVVTFEIEAVQQIGREVNGTELSLCIWLHFDLFVSNSFQEEQTPCLIA